MIQKIIEKYCAQASYELKDNFISFALPRDDTSDESLHAQDYLKETEPLISVPNIEIPKETLQTYDILDPDALEEFEHYVSKLQTEISMMGSSSLEIEDIDTMNEYLKRLTTILSVSGDAYEVAESLRAFSALLDEYSEPFLSMSSDLSHMLTSFINDIIMWKEMIFYSGAPSVDFLNSSISSNVQMIRAVFVQDETEAEELDDIFDF